MSETTTKEREAEEKIRIPMSTIAMLEFFEKEIVQKRIIPIEERIKRIEDRQDYILTQTMSDITKNSITAAYNLLSDELKKGIVKEVRQAIIDELTDYSKNVSNLINALNNVAKIVEQMTSTIEFKLSQIGDKMTKIEPRVQIDSDKLASDLKPSLERAVSSIITKELELKTQDIVKSIDAEIPKIATKIDEAGKSLESLVKALDNLTGMITNTLKILQEHKLLPGEEEVTEQEDTEQEGDIDEFDENQTEVNGN